MGSAELPRTQPTDLALAPNWITFVRAEIITQPTRRTTATLVAASVLGAVLIASSLQQTDSDLRAMLTAEGGIVQTLSALGYIACIAVLLAKAGVHSLAQRWYMPALLLSLTLREFDFHTRFSTKGIFKSSFYLSTEVPAAEKLAALAVTAIIATAVAALTWRHLAGFLKNLRRKDPAAIAFSCAAGCAVVSEIIDGMGRKLATIGLELSAHAAQNAVVVEELAELGIPLMLTLAASLSRHEARSVNRTAAVGTAPRHLPCDPLRKRR